METKDKIKEMKQEDVRKRKYERIKKKEEKDAKKSKKTNKPRKPVRRVIEFSSEEEDVDGDL